MSDLPEYMQVCFDALLGVMKEMEDNVTREGRSYRMYYAKEGVSRILFVFNCFHIQARLSIT